MTATRISALSARPAEEAWLTYPGATPHAWWNAGDDQLHFLVDSRPALRTEEFFESYYALAQNGKTHPKTGMTNLRQTAVLVREFEDEVYLARPPLSVQRALFAPLALVGRLLGYRAHHPYPYARQREASPSAG